MDENVLEPGVAAAAGPTSLVRLPRGRHRVPRRAVVEHQRRRILTAVEEVTATLGYSAATIEDIVLAAGVSRRTFYDQFEGKDAAFVAVFEEAVGRIEARVVSALAGVSGFDDVCRRALGAVLAFVADEPAAAALCIVESPAGTPAIVARRDELLELAAALLEGTAAEAGLGDARFALTARAVVGGVCAVLYRRLVAGAHSDAPALVDELLYAVLLPYVGHAKALASSGIGSPAAPAAH